MRLEVRRVRIAFAMALMMTAAPSFADWHYGTITELGGAYDGSTINLRISGWNRTDCTCYVAWPNTACLSRSRTGFREEYAQLLSARRAGTTIGINIDEATCSIRAVYELD